MYNKKLTSETGKINLKRDLKTQKRGKLKTRENAKKWSQMVLFTNPVEDVEKNTQWYNH